jgi:orotidine-5'-phosphate decarboxylase
MSLALDYVESSAAKLMSLDPQDRLIVALDVPTVEEAREVVAQLDSAVTFYKIGMQLQFAGGIQLAQELIGQEKKIFLDSKLLDIDQTITSAVANIAKMGVTFLTVHGPARVVQAAVKGRANSHLKILSVTVLTSLDATDLADLGFECSVEELVLKRSRAALDAGADGVIASGQEANAIRKIAGNKLTIVTPGIRPDGSDVGDQKRAVTPAAAIRAGADYLVMGRPIVQAPNRRQAAEGVLEEIRQAAQA